MRRNMITASLAIILAAVALGTGCSPTRTAPRRVEVQSSTQSTEAPQSADETMTGSIPSLEFVDPTSLPKGVGVGAGTLQGAKYRVVISGSHITSVRLIGEGSDAGSVIMTLDSEGSAILRHWTATHLLDGLAVVLDKRVMAIPRIESPLVGGQLMFRLKNPKTDGAALVGAIHRE